MPYCEKHKEYYENGTGGCPQCTREGLGYLILIILAGLVYFIPKYIAKKSDPKNKVRNVLIYFASLIVVIIIGYNYKNIMLKVEEMAWKGKGSTFTDSRDGKSYKTIKIGSQIWMAKNLNYKADGSKCYDNDEANCKKYGRLYDWNTAMKACPSGWHLPSESELEVLYNAVGGKNAGKKLKSKNGWYNDLVFKFCNDATNEYGFSALPGGRVLSDGDFNGNVTQGHWWSASEYDASSACRNVDSRISDMCALANAHKDKANYAYGWNLNCFSDGLNRDSYNKSELYSVRCVKNEIERAGEMKEAAVQPKPIAEQQIANEASGIESQKENIREEELGTPDLSDKRDGKTYKTIKIGSQIWMAENLNYKASGSKCYDNDEKNCQKYGRLYDWNTAMKTCPSGWHLPNLNELVVDDKRVAGKKLKAKSGWDNNGNGTDDFGFSALPGGRGISDGSFDDVGNDGLWWSSSERDSYYAYYWSMSYNHENVHLSDSSKSGLFSVRCVQD